MSQTYDHLRNLISKTFPTLAVTQLTDALSVPYLQVTQVSPHPVLITSTSVHLNIYLLDQYITSKLIAYSMVVLREVNSLIEEEVGGEGKMMEVLKLLESRQTSVCVGIPEEVVSARSVAENLGRVLVEKFRSSVVVRARDCQTVILEQDDMIICNNCQKLKNMIITEDTNSEEIIKQYVETEPDVKLEPEVEMNSKETEILSDVLLKTESPLKMKIKVAKIPKIKCPESNCKRKFSKYKALVKHCKNVHYFDETVKFENIKLEFESIKRSKCRPSNDPSAPNKCPDCDKCFWTHKSLVKHCVKIHKRVKEECPKPNYEQYLEKKKAVSNLPDKFGCQYCPKMFKFSSSLIAHTKRYHTETEMVPCEHCGKEVKQSNMEMHYKNNHATPRFTCNQCGKAFYFKALMVSHINVMHEGLKNHICDLCGAKFGIKKSLERHVRCQHEDHRPFVCEYCQKAFHTAQKLKKHISGHMKDKIYVCPVCDARFYYKDNVRMHMRKSHPEVDPKTECKVIDNPDSGAGQVIHSMEAGRRMRLSNNKSSSSCRVPDPSPQQYGSPYQDPVQKSYYSPIVGHNEPQSSNTREYTERVYDVHRDMVKNIDNSVRSTMGVPDHGVQGEDQRHQQYLHHGRQDLSSYLLGLRYNYSPYNNHQQ